MPQHGHLAFQVPLAGQHLILSTWHGELRGEVAFTHEGCDNRWGAVALLR